MGNVGSLPGVKPPGREVDNSSLSSVEVMNEWSYTSTPSMRLRGMGRDSFAFDCIGIIATDFMEFISSNSLSSHVMSHAGFTTVTTVIFHIAASVA
jgi:hypothetical protein